MKIYPQQFWKRCKKLLGADFAQSPEEIRGPPGLTDQPKMILKPQGFWNSS